MDFTLNGITFHFSSPEVDYLVQTVARIDATTQELLRIEEEHHHPKFRINIKWRVKEKDK